MNTVNIRIPFKPTVKQIESAQKQFLFRGKQAPGKKYHLAQLPTGDLIEFWSGRKVTHITVMFSRNTSYDYVFGHMHNCIENAQQVAKSNLRDGYAVCILPVEVE